MLERSLAYSDQGPVKLYRREQIYQVETADSGRSVAAAWHSARRSCSVY